jgi:hypothetical protein
MYRLRKLRQWPHLLDFFGTEKWLDENSLLNISLLRYKAVIWKNVHGRVELDHMRTCVLYQNKIGMLRVNLDDAVAGFVFNHGKRILRVIIQIRSGASCRDNCHQTCCCCSDQQEQQDASKSAAAEISHYQS